MRMRNHRYSFGRRVGGPGGPGLLLALATASMLVAGCAAGQQAQTAQQQSTIDGTNAGV